MSALLEQLRASQAWADLNEVQSADKPAVPQERPDEQTTESSTSMVANLLSQLREPDPGIASPEKSSVPGSRKDASLRNYTFQQALPRLSQLSEDASFVAKVEKVRVFELGSDLS